MVAGWRKLQKDKIAFISVLLLIAIFLLGIFAPLIAPNDPNLANIAMKYKGISKTYWLGTDQLGRCVFSRLLYGIRTTVFLAMLTMIVTMTIGITFGLLAGYLKGHIDNFLMRVCDVLLSFPSEVMILAIVGLLYQECLILF